MYVLMKFYQTLQSFYGMKERFIVSRDTDMCNNIEFISHSQLEVASEEERREREREQRKYEQRKRKGIEGGGR